MDIEDVDKQAACLRRMNLEIVVFIPAYNEEETILSTVESAWKIEGVTRVVVIDDCSHNSTKREALIGGASVISLNTHRGKGGALMAGISDYEFDFCMFLDADLGTCAEQGILLLAPVVSGELDMSIARFPKTSKRTGLGKVKKLAASAISEVNCDFECLSPLSGQRAFSAECIGALLPLADGFGVEVALTIKALKLGFKVGEIETLMEHRQTSNTPAGYAHRLRQYLDVQRALKTL